MIVFAGRAGGAAQGMPGRQSGASSLRIRKPSNLGAIVTHTHTGCARFDDDSAVWSSQRPERARQNDILRDGATHQTQACPLVGLASNIFRHFYRVHDFGMRYLCGR